MGDNTFPVVRGVPECWNGVDMRVQGTGIRMAMLVAALLSVVGLNACLNGPGASDGPDLVIRTVDAQGNGFGVDSVSWSYYGDAGMLHKPGHGTDSTYKPAVQANDAGTEWHVRSTALHGSVFVRAWGRHEDGLCLDIGYGIREINADSLPQVVTLQVDVTRVCQ